MIRNNLSARSRGTSLTFRRHRGFTMIEVMMSIVLVATDRLWLFRLTVTWLKSAS